MRQVMTSSSSYNYSSTTANHVDPPRTPPPHRSPSPVSFPMPPEPLSGYTYRRDEMNSYTNTRQRSRSRSPPPQPFPVHNVHTYSVGGLYKEPCLW